jgi:hypothetical protein
LEQQENIEDFDIQHYSDYNSFSFQSDDDFAPSSGSFSPIGSSLSGHYFSENLGNNADTSK